MADEKPKAEKAKSSKMKMVKNYEGPAIPEVAAAPAGYATIFFDCLSGGHTEVNYCYVDRKSAAYDAYETKFGKNNTFKHRVIAII